MGRTYTEKRPELVEKIISLWNEGESSNSIARILGIESRGVVVGKLDRLRKAGDSRITREPFQRPKFIERRPRQVAPQAPKAERVPFTEPDDSCRTTLLAIGSGKCRFIVGEPSGMTCCGHPGFPYCGYHTAITHTKGKSDEADVAA